MGSNEPSGNTPLVDVMIAVTVLGLMAAVAIPQIREPGPGSRAALLVERLAEFRGAIDEYWAEHEAGFPGRDGADALLDQLGHTTDAAGRIGGGDDGRYVHGPYLPSMRFPQNPLTHTATVRVVSEMPGHPVGSEAWIYDSTSGDVRCNLLGRDLDGQRWFDY